MSNALYAKGREGILDGTMDMAGDVRLALLAAGYTPDLAAHDMVDDLGANIVARSGALTGKTYTAGVFDHAVETVAGVSGAQITRVAYFQHTGADATARLIALVDTATGLPVTPNGGDIIFTPDTGANKAFKL